VNLYAPAPHHRVDRRLPRQGFGEVGELVVRRFIGTLGPLDEQRFFVPRPVSMRGSYPHSNKARGQRPRHAFTPRHHTPRLRRQFTRQLIDGNRLMRGVALQPLARFANTTSQLQCHHALIWPPTTSSCRTLGPPRHTSVRARQAARATRSRRHQRHRLSNISRAIRIASRSATNASSLSTTRPCAFHGAIAVITGRASSCRSTARSSDPVTCSMCCPRF